MKRHLAIALVMVCTAAASAEIVNIDATVNGSPFWGFPQVEVPVTPGHYRATLVNPSLNSAALYTAWSYVYGDPGTWRTQYRFRFADGSTLIGGSTANTDDAQSAFDATLEKTLEFDVSTAQTLEFHVIDSEIGDNVGGVSLDLTLMGSSTSSTTTSTSTTAPPTTTTVPSGCDGIPDGATFSSLVCRVQALRDRANGESGLGAFQPKLVKSLDTALERLGDARTRCGESNLKKARKRLQQTGKALTQYAHRLSGRPARKKLDDALRVDFLAAGQAIAPDVATLRGAVACPGDAAT